MKDNPLISIYMPTWNRQQLAIRAIKSVLRQDYSNWSHTPFCTLTTTFAREKFIPIKRAKSFDTVLNFF